MKANSKNRSGNIFESIKKEEEKEENAKKNSVETTVKSDDSVNSATKKAETMAKNTNKVETPEKPIKSEQNEKVAETVSNNPGNNYLNKQEKEVDTTVNNGLLYITPTRKKTRSHRKGFLLSDLALNNLQKEAAKYEISENELINQILEKMI
jgi:hypothetical protein